MEANNNQLIVTNTLGVLQYRPIIKALMLLSAIIFLQACQNPPEENVSQEQEKEHPNITKLKAQGAEFTPEIIKLNERVYAAVGYDGSNASIIVGDDGVVIIDALRALGAAEKVAQEEIWQRNK